MAKYQIESYPQDKYSFRIYINNGKKSWQNIKKETGCHALINLEYYNMTTFKPDTALMSAGKWLSPDKYFEYGVCIDKDGFMKCGTNKEAVYDYAVAVPTMYYNGKVDNSTYFNNTKDKNGATAVGFKQDGTPVLFLCSKDTPMSSNEVCKTMIDYGCNTILRYDGSWSSQGDLGNGKVVDPSQERIVHNYLLVFKKTEQKTDKPAQSNPVVSTPVPNKRYTVCLDAGHYGKSGNASPDKSYWEYKFAWDITQREKKLLEYNGFNVVLTKDSEVADKSLTDRAGVSNTVKADLFVSNHTNAAGGTGWSTPRGLEIYTSYASATAGRNIAANKMIARFKEAGIVLRQPTLRHNNTFTVLIKTNAPAVLIEYGFHTNKDDVALLLNSVYRDKLAEAVVKGVCDYFGVAYVGSKAEEKPTEPKPKPTTPDATEPNYDADAWALEYVKKAISKGVFAGDGDGNYKMKDSITRQELCIVLDRLGLLD